MKLLKLTVILLVTMVLISYIKSHAKFNVIKGLPFADGEDVNIYHWASLAILLITCWGFYRLTRKNNDDE